MPNVDFSTVDYLTALLRARFAISNVQVQAFAPNWSTPDDIITTHRFIIVLRGRLHYEVEGVVVEVEAGQQLFVPEWVRRIWGTSDGLGCEIIWCEFTADEVNANLSVPYLREHCDLALEVGCMRRMLEMWPGLRLAMEVRGRRVPDTILSVERKLQIEGELKAMLGRFWSEARPCGVARSSDPSINPRLHPDLRRALLWLNEYALEPDALELLFQEIKLSPNHFRLIFRRALGSSPQDYVSRIRLRRARYLIHNTQLPLKQIASMVGYADPLFFSRHYHRFWGHSPREDRLR